MTVLNPYSPSGIGWQRHIIPNALPELNLPSTAYALKVGTGGAETARYYNGRGDMGYAVAQYSASPVREPDPVRLPLDNLTYVRSVLNSTVTELARVLRVSRQTIYDWQSGAEMTLENANKVAALAKAADVFAEKGVAKTHQILRRLVAGKNFYDKVLGGEEPQQIALALMGIVERELAQRQALESRLKDRKKLPLDADEIGAPHLNERE